MRIVILNECFFTEENILRLKKMGDVVLYKNTDTEEKTIARIKDAHIVIGDQFIAKFNKKVLESTKKLKLLALNTTSFGYVDTTTAKLLGIHVANTPGFSKQAVAEFTLGLLFTLNRNIALGDREMRIKSFELDPGKKEDLRYMGFEIRGKTLGLIGLGNIGATVGQMAKALGMEVLAVNKSGEKVDGIKIVTMQELLKKSDIISLHLPLTAETKNLLGEKEMKSMKPTALIINTSQTEIINTDDLYEALNSKKIAGVALDAGNMIKSDHPLFKLQNVVITPHMGSFTHDAFFVTLPKMIIENIEAFVKGKSKNIVN